MVKEALCLGLVSDLHYNMKERVVPVVARTIVHLAKNTIYHERNQIHPSTVSFALKENIASSGNIQVEKESILRILQTS